MAKLTMAPVLYFIKGLLNSPYRWPSKIIYAFVNILQIHNVIYKNFDRAYNKGFINNKI